MRKGRMERESAPRAPPRAGDRPVASHVYGFHPNNIRPHFCIPISPFLDIRTKTRPFPADEVTISFPKTTVNPSEVVLVITTLQVIGKPQTSCLLRSPVQ